MGGLAGWLALLLRLCSWCYGKAPILVHSSVQQSPSLSRCCDKPIYATRTILLRAPIVATFCFCHSLHHLQTSSGCIMKHLKLTMADLQRIANIIVGADTDTLGMEKENNTQHWVPKPIYDHVFDCLKRHLANRKVFDKYYYNSKINNNFWTDDLRPLVKMEHARALMYEANNPHYYRQEVIPPAIYVAHGFYESGHSHDHSENNIVLFYEACCTSSCATRQDLD